MLHIGFGKVDITPRVGVEMSGFGPYISRRGLAVRDRLYAKAMAVRQDGRTLVVVSCDLIEVVASFTQQVRRRVTEATGLPGEAIMLHCTHTHSGPAVCAALRGWGEIDLPYYTLLPARIAAACIAAVKDLAPATLRHAEVPCEGVGINREDEKAPPLEAVLDENWRPALPHRTDTTCHVMTIHRGNQLAGFVSSFGCHPVVCCAATTFLHGDYCGVATNLLERENPGSVGLFLQGAQGDVNSCVVHQPEPESMLALDVVASRYARAVRQGLREARPVDVDKVAFISRAYTFTRRPLTVEQLETMLAEHRATLDKPAAADNGREERMATIFVDRLTDIIGRLKSGDSMHPPAEIQGFRLGPIALLTSPFEIMQAIKRDILAKTKSPVPIVMGITNDTHGYAPDNERLSRPTGYAAHTIPYVMGQLPHQNIHNELAAAMAEVDAILNDE